VRRRVLTLLAIAVPLSCGGRSEERQEATGGKGGSAGKGGDGASGGTAATGGMSAAGGMNAGGALAGGPSVGGGAGVPAGGAGGSGAGTGGGSGSGGNAGMPCNPELEHNRDYLGNVETCARADFICMEPTTGFSNACGCGCEQDASCPPAFECGPNARPAPGFACTPENLARCPFSEELP
jgi:hypothetical protein